MPSLFAHPAEHARADARRERIERSVASPATPSRARRRARTTAASERSNSCSRSFLQQVGQRDAHRTDDTALVAHRRRLRQLERVLEADVRRREDRADRSRIHPAVGVAADVLVHRAMIHARAAADAVQRLPDFAAEDARASGIDEDEVHVLGAVELARRPWSRSGCRRSSKSTGRSRNAAAGAAASRRPRAWARSSRCPRSRHAPWAASSSASRCLRWSPAPPSRSRRRRNCRPRCPCPR